MARRPGLVFLTSIPHTYGQNPWLLEIEDPTTLFYPLIHNGHTSHVQLSRSPFFPIVKALLESRQCKGILTHMKSTQQLVGTLFDSEIIRGKVHYTPVGVKLPARWQRHEPQLDDEPIDLLFINSWSQIPANFLYRGGLDVLEAFAILRRRYPQLRLTLRSHLPRLYPRFYRIMEAGWVRVIDRFLLPEEMADLHARSHIFLLPAARIHILSLLQAMSYGLAVVASDGWGIDEYISHERNGLVVKGRYGKVSWADEEAGILRENYGPMSEPDPVVVEGLVQAISRLVEDRELRARLGQAARADVETKYNMSQWNRGLKTVLDKALGNGDPFGKP
jgi:glycosyltransferase involved in cell wall biosynthesis